MCKPKVLLCVVFFCLVLGFLGGIHVPKRLADIVTQPDKPIHIEPHPPATTPLQNCPAEAGREDVVIRLKIE